MAEESSKQQPRRRSEARQKGEMIGFRVTPEEKAEIEAAAEQAGLTVGSFVRDRILTKCKTGKRRKPSLDRVLLSKTLAQLGKVGSNLNQAVRLGHEGHVRGVERAVSFVDELRALKESILDALRRMNDN